MNNPIAALYAILTTVLIAGYSSDHRSTPARQPGAPGRWESFLAWFR